MVANLLRYITGCITQNINQRTLKISKEKTWGLFVTSIVSLGIILQVSCGVTKTTEKCDKEKKECCSKK